MSQFLKCRTLWVITHHHTLVFVQSTWLGWDVTKAANQSKAWSVWYTMSLAKCLACNSFWTYIDVCLVCLCFHIFETKNIVLKVSGTSQKESILCLLRGGHGDLRCWGFLNAVIWCSLVFLQCRGVQTPPMTPLTNKPLFHQSIKSCKSWGRYLLPH